MTFEPPESLEAAIEELESIVEQLESGNLTLNDMLALYKRGEQLAAWCDQTLQQAELIFEELEPLDNGDIDGSQ